MYTPQPSAKQVYLDEIVAKKGKAKAGAGRGLEPLPWCKCHDRNPCPNKGETVSTDVDFYGEKK